MSEPTNTPAQAPTQAPAPSAPQQQAPQNQPPTQAAPPPPAAPPPTGTPPATPPAPLAPSPELIALQKQNQEAQRKITELGQKAGELQRQRDALIGSQPPQPAADPIAPYVKMLVDKGYDPKDARDVAEVQWAMMQPAMQSLQQTQAATHGMAMVQDVMRETWTSAPHLFASNPAIGQQVEQILRNDAASGRPIDAQYAANVAKIVWADDQMARMNGNQPPPPQQLPPSFQSMYAPPNGFAAPTPPVNQPPQLTPEQQKWNDDIQRQFKTTAR